MEGTFLLPLKKISQRLSPGTPTTPTTPSKTASVGNATPAHTLASPSPSPRILCMPTTRSEFPRSDTEDAFLELGSTPASHFLEVRKNFLAHFPSSYHPRYYPVDKCFCPCEATRRIFSCLVLFNGCRLRLLKAKALGYIRLMKRLANWLKQCLKRRERNIQEIWKMWIEVDGTPRQQQVLPSKLFERRRERYSPSSKSPPTLSPVLTPFSSPNDVRFRAIRWLYWCKRAFFHKSYQMWSATRHIRLTEKRYVQDQLDKESSLALITDLNVRLFKIEAELKRMERTRPTFRFEVSSVSIPELRCALQKHCLMEDHSGLVVRTSPLNVRSPSSESLSSCGTSTLETLKPTTPALSAEGITPTTFRNVVVPRTPLTLPVSPRIPSSTSQSKGGSSGHVEEALDACSSTSTSSSQARGKGLNPWIERFETRNNSPKLETLPGTPTKFRQLPPLLNLEGRNSPQLQLTDSPTLKALHTGRSSASLPRTCSSGLFTFTLPNTASVCSFSSTPKSMPRNLTFSMPTPTPALTSNEKPSKKPLKQARPRTPGVDQTSVLLSMLPDFSLDDGGDDESAGTRSTASVTPSPAIELEFGSIDGVCLKGRGRGSLPDPFCIRPTAESSSTSIGKLNPRQKLMKSQSAQTFRLGN